MSDHSGGGLIEQGRVVPAGNGLEWLADAWALTGQQRGTFIAVFVLYLAISVAVSLIPRIGFFVITLLGPVLNGGVMLGCAALRRGEKLEVEHVFAGLRNHAGKLLGVGAVTLAAFAAIFAVVALTVGGEVAAVLMGAVELTLDNVATLFVGILIALLIILVLSVPIYMAIWFAPPLIALGQQDVGQALKASFAASLKNIVPFSVWGFAVLGLAIAATLPLALGWLLLGPVLMVSVYTSYEDVFLAR